MVGVDGPFFDEIEAIVLPTCSFPLGFLCYYMYVKAYTPSSNLLVDLLEGELVSRRHYRAKQPDFGSTVLFRPTVHEFGNFGLREGRKIHFRFMANFKSGLFFGCDAL
jgi:hypothetical protein